MKEILGICFYVCFGDDGEKNVLVVWLINEGLGLISCPGEVKSSHYLKPWFVLTGKQACIYVIKVSTVTITPRQRVECVA